MPELSSILRKRSPVVHTLAPQAKVREAVEVMQANEVGIVAVLDGKELVGLFSERDLLRRVIAVGKKLDTTELSEVMTRSPVTAAPTETRADAVNKMQERGCRHLPILQGGLLVDMLSMRDLMVGQLQDRNNEIKSLHSYIQGNPC
jgi:CBS domain-containing protein